MCATTLLRATTVAVLLGLFVASPAAAQLGELDASFAEDGIRVLDNVGVEAAYDAVIQPDGKIVVAGFSPGAGADFSVARLHADGRLDTGFDDDGVAFVDFGGYDQAFAAALQGDGRIVVAGSTTAGGGNGAVARLRPNGMLDTSFGAGDTDGDGKRTIEYFGALGADSSHDVVVQPDGRIVVAGQGGPSTALAVTRLQPNGTDDISFDGDGIAGADAGGAESGRAVALQGDGRIVVAGVTTVSEDILVARFNPAGPADMTRDASFGPLGLGWTTFGFGGYDRATEVLVQGDGRLVVTGSGGTSTALAAVRLNPGGRDFDTSFDGDGTAVAEFGGTETGNAGLLQPDGKIVVVGSTTLSYDIAVARFKAAGRPEATLDTSFGGGGMTMINAGGYDVGWGAALQADGKIVIAGETDRGAVVARLHGDAVPGPGGGPAPGGDDQPPRISRLSLHPRRFAVTGRRPGTRIRFTLSEPADVTMTIERARFGRRVGGICRPAGRSGRRCTLWRRAGRMRHAGGAGANSVRFSGRLQGRHLKAGRHRLRLIAVDAAGQRSQPRRARFTVLRGGR
jgi:uncharacterized delta-60 repeat protein